MPDASDPRGRGPAGWSDAFAALPPETPPADAWARVAARLDAATAAPAAPTAASPAALPGAAARRHRGRRPVRAAGWLGAAAAAALALVVAWPRQEAAPDAVRALPASPPSVAANATSAPATAAGADSAMAASGRKPGSDGSAIALPKVVEASRKPRYAARQAPARAASPVPAPGAAGDATAPSPAVQAAGEQPLDALYAESARLEALLALARDDRVSTASAALLSAELDAQVAAIDVRLAQPGLDGAQRTALWRARVDALRQAAGFESTQRVLASQGDGGALLVSVD